MFSIVLLPVLLLFLNRNLAIAMESSPLRIEVLGTGTSAHPSVYFSGADVHTITHDERTEFDMHDDKLKECVERYFGAHPDDAWLHEPTGDFSLYNSYGWSEVKVTLQPRSAEVVSSSSSPAYVGHRIFDNTLSTGPSTSTVELTSEESNTVENSWSNSHAVSVGQTVSIGVAVEGLSAGMEQSFEVSNEFGSSVAESESTSDSIKDTVSVTLQPGEVRYAAIEVNRVILSVNIVYEAHLTGGTAVNYGGKHKGHHFWSLDINRVLESCGLSTTRTIEHKMDITGFSRGRHVFSSTPLSRMAVRADAVKPVKSLK